MKIEIQNIDISYGILKRKKVIKNLSFDMQSGEIVILYGKNGVGKTTILRAICGELPIEKGKILWNGKDLTNEMSKRRRLSSGNFESGKMLYHYATLRENILFNTNLLRSVDLEPITFSYNYFNYEELLDKTIDEMSLGQRQKSSLICAFRKPAELYFFDEPDNGLDRSSIKEFCKIISNKPYNNSIVVIATHDSFLVKEVGSKIIFLSGDGFYKVVTKDLLPKDITQLDEYLCLWLQNEKV